MRQPVVFTILFFLSASLIFSVQPMLGKMMLPYVGGSPAGWIVALAFFQIALLGGYAFAHICSKLNVFSQALLTLIVLAAGFLILPVRFDSTWIDQFEKLSPGIVFVKLTMAISLPFIALSSITPAMQRVFSAGTHETKSDPYYFYAASNLGSFFGLLSYPFLVEPFATLDTQSTIWSSLYALLFVICAGASVMIFASRTELIRLGLTNKQTRDDAQAAGTTRPSRNTLLYWFFLAAVPCSLILGVTKYITTDVASIPMIWIIPLGLYLLTHVWAFARRRIEINETTLALFQALFVAVSIALYFRPETFNVTPVGMILIGMIFLAALTSTGMLLHKQLADSRPEASQLTWFYFMISLGGAVGGSFNAFIAPVIFNEHYELPLVLALSLMLSPLVWRHGRKALERPFWFLVGAGMLSFVAGKLFSTEFHAPMLGDVMFFLFVAVAFVSVIELRALIGIGLAAILLEMLVFSPRSYLVVERNFFGVSKVYDRFADTQTPEDGHTDTSTMPSGNVRIYRHGSTTHGIQSLDEAYKTDAFSYYPPVSPAGHVYRTFNVHDVGVLGLGAGVMACYNRYFPGISTTFFEIDSYVAEVAKSWFDFLPSCGYEDILIGDGRLLIERLPDERKFDLLVMDVYTSDAIPLHLVTREAIGSYFDHLNEGGAMVFNISNRHLDLRPPLAAIAKSYGKGSYWFAYISDPDISLTLDSLWMLITDSGEMHDELLARGWEPAEPLAEGQPVWTDNFSNLMSVFLKLRFDSDELDDWRQKSESLREYMKQHVDWLETANTDSHEGGESK